MQVEKPVIRGADQDSIDAESSATTFASHGSAVPPVPPVWLDQQRVGDQRGRRRTERDGPRLPYGSRTLAPVSDATNASVHASYSGGLSGLRRLRTGVAGRPSWIIAGVDHQCRLGLRHPRGGRLVTTRRATHLKPECAGSMRAGIMRSTSAAPTSAGSWPPRSPAPARARQLRRIPPAPCRASPAASMATGARCRWPPTATKPSRGRPPCDGRGAGSSCAALPVLGGIAPSTRFQ